MYILAPHGFPVLCSWMIFIDEYFLPSLVIVQAIDLIDQGPWESTKQTIYFFQDVSHESIPIITQTVVTRSATRGCCLHFNLAFICVLSSKDSCHEAESPVSGLCLDKVNK